MRAFIAADAAINGPRNLWRPKADTVTRPVTITFGPEIVIADGAMLPIPSAGTQSMRAVTLRPQMLEFATQLTTARGGNVIGIVTYKSPLRLPAPDPVQAEDLAPLLSGHSRWPHHRRPAPLDPADKDRTLGDGNRPAHGRGRISAGRVCQLARR